MASILRTWENRQVQVQSFYIREKPSSLLWGIEYRYRNDHTDKHRRNVLKVFGVLECSHLLSVSVGNTMLLGVKRVY